MGCGCARVCRGSRAPDPPPQREGSARRLLPAPNTGRQTPSRWSLQSRGPHPQAAVPTSWPAARRLWLLRTLSRPLSSLPPPPFLAHSLGSPGPHFPSPGSSLDCRGTPHRRRSRALQPPPPVRRPPTHSGRTPAPARWPTWPTRSAPWRRPGSDTAQALRTPRPQSSACLPPRVPPVPAPPGPAPPLAPPQPRFPRWQAGLAAGGVPVLPGASSPTPSMRAWALELRKGPCPAPARPSSVQTQPARLRWTRVGAGLQARTPEPRGDPSPEVSAGPASASSGPGLAQVWTGVASAGNPLLRD